MPRFYQFRRFGPPFAALLTLAAAAGHGAAAHAQSSEDRDRFAVPTVEPEVTGPLNGFRRQIDPDAQRDPFAGDRDAEDDRDSRQRARRGRSLGGARVDAPDADASTDLQSGDNPGAAENAEDPARPPPVQAPPVDSRDAAKELVDNQVERAGEGVGGPYDPVGIRLGSFLLFPELTTETLYTDNALITADNPQSDSALVLTPKLKLKSNWSRHYFEANLGAERSYYSEFDLQNDEAYNVDLLGRLDVTRRTQIEATALRDRTLEEIDAVDAVTGAAERTPITTSGGTTQLSHRFNRLTAALRGGITDFDYDDVPLIGGGIANNDDRDYTERKLTGRLSYEFRPGVSSFVEGSGNTHRYASLIDDDGIRRGSDGHEVKAGVAVDLGGKLKGEMAAGYALQDPDEMAFDNISGFIFDAGVTWRPSALTTVRFAAGSDIQETTLVDSPGSILHTTELSVEHALRRNLIAGVSVGYAEEDFQGSNQIDKDYIFGLNGEYLLNPSVALVASYEHIKSTSTVDDDTLENQVRVGVRLRR